MTALDSWLAPAPGSEAPLWTLEGLRGADPILGFALVMLMAVALAELLHRKLRAPRMLGHMITGALASPLALRLLDRTDLDPWKPIIDLAIGVLVFELGSRIRPRWLLDNPWLAFTCVLEGLLAGLCVAATLAWLGAPVTSAWLAGAVAMSTSPVIVLVLVHEVRSRGQVTERLLIITALNSALAMLALKAWNVFTAAGSTTLGHDLLPVATDAVLVVGGSFLLGVAAGWLLAKLNQPLRDAAAAPVLQIALVILAAMLAAQWQLSPLFALMVAGMVARSRMGHTLLVEPQLGSAGAVLTVLLFIALGMLFTLDGIATLWPWVLAILVARMAGKGIAVALLARLSALGWRQAAALTLALQPMSSLAVLLAGNTFGWSSQLPGVAAGVLQALLIATTLSHFFGPLLTKWSLQTLAGESPKMLPKRA
ncbi:MAG: cation:proton antiporter [Rhizobacter sp.]|nr:cation:proton antiporter [Rhizobacter sp.]